MTDQAVLADRPDTFRSIDAATGQAVGEAFAIHGMTDVEAACAAAAAASRLETVSSSRSSKRRWRMRSAK